jgi:tetratricopeptide (TPR) repeat protein
MPVSPAEALRESEKNTQALLLRNPNNLAMLAQLGYTRKDLASVYFQEGRIAKGSETLESAEQCFKNVLALDTNDPSAHNGLGNVYAMRGDQDAAIKEYDIATTLAPEYTYAWFDLALTLRAKLSEGHLPGTRSIELLQRLALVVVTVLKLHLEGDQKLPPAAFDAIMEMKDWVLKAIEAVKR